MSRRSIIAGALAALALFTAFDHGMRKMQLADCQRGDSVSCPTKLWWFMPVAMVENFMPLPG